MKNKRLDFCPLCERRYIYHTAQEKKDCKQTLDLLEKMSGRSIRNTGKDSSGTFGV
jgi:hypothetical protein